MNDKYTAEQIDACILCYKSGDLNYCRQGIIDLLSSYATHLREREAAKGVPHPDDVAVDLFAFAMKEKLAEARSKGRGGWQDKDDCPQSRLSNMLRGHVEKGDPRDVANFCMFLHQRGESILPSESAKAGVTDEITMLARRVVFDAGEQIEWETMRAALDAVAPMLASARVPDGWQWIDGVPTHPWDKEWFIAELNDGSRVVLTALPKEYTYDFKTADETYLARRKIKRWMQFPDSEFVAAPKHGEG